MSKKIITAAMSLTMLAVSFTVLAETNMNFEAKPIDPTPKILCIGAAVNVREQALATAITAYNGSVNSAYANRANALRAAYTLTTANTVKIAVKKAWTDFNTSLKTARKNWQDAKNLAWKNFRKASATCKAPASIVGNANVSSEVLGN